MITGVSLFAGVGGFDLAMERQGVKVVASVEIDKHCKSVLERKFPEAKLFDDVTTVKGSDLIAAGFNPSTGIIAGGFPCQDLSVAGKRAGLAGARSGLFWEAARIVEEAQSEYFILENVPGLLSSNKGADFGVVLGTMADLGYSVGWRVLDAQYFGLPQRRKRVFVVGRRSAGGSVAEILFKSEGLRRDSSQSKPTRKDPATSITTSIRKASLGSGKDVANCIPAELYHHGTVVNQDANNGNRVNDVRIQDGVINTLQARMGTGGNNMPMVAYPIQGTVIGRSDIAGPAGKGYGETDDPMFTIDTVGGHAVATESQVRRLTPLECERLQGFPDDWTASQSDSARYKQMGNAVAVPVVEWIIQGIVDTLI